MKCKWLIFSGLFACIAVSLQGAVLQFTNVSMALNYTNPTTLRAVAYGGASSFVAVGDKMATVAGNFAPTNNFLTAANWQTGVVSSAAAISNTNLFAVASSGSMFLASGGNNLIFGTTNGNAWSTNFGKTFGNGAQTFGMAFNGGKFVAVGASVANIAYTINAPQPPTNWSTASLNAPSFIESFRGVTPFGANGFAVCGVFGDVRVTTNAANTWFQQFGQVGQPDFFGIAANNKTIVCVGATNSTAAGAARSFILTSTNGGTNWFGSYLAVAATNTQLNAVSYSPTFGFIAVGTNGVVLISSNGLANTWIQISAPTIPNSPSHLNGVVFANSGFMNGVGELVGASGNVILCGLPPLAPISWGNQSTCVGSTQALTVSVTNNLVSTNIIVVDWYDSPTNGMLLNQGTNSNNGTNSYTPLRQDENTNSVITYYAESRDLRTGFVSTDRTPVILTNFMRPTIVVNTSKAICNGMSETVDFRLLTGNSPWKITWEVSLTNGASIITSNIIQYITNNTVALPNGLGINSNLLVRPTNSYPNIATNYFYRVIRLEDAHCDADHAGDITGVGQITVNPRPTVSVISTNTICNGSDFLLQANLTGLSPWTVGWSDGFVQTVTNPTIGVGAVLSRVVSASQVTNIFANLPTNYTFTVVGVTNTSIATCQGNQPGDITGTGLVTVNPRPTANVITTNTICNGQFGLVQLQANLTGLSPWTVVWSDGFVQTTNAPLGSGATVIRGVQPSQVTNIFANLPTNYTFTVVGVTNTSIATCQGNQPGDITGTGLVTVNPRPKASLVTGQTICNGQFGLVQLQANLTGLSPWTVVWSDGFVQTTNAPLGSGATVIRGVQPLQVTNTLPNNLTNFTFTVTSVTNADTCTGNQPGDLTCTNIITVNPRPTASLLSFISTNCNDGSPYTLTNTLTGLGPWYVYWNDGTKQTNSTSGSGPVTLARTVYPTNAFAANAVSNNVYFVTAVSNADMCIGNQPGDILGTNTLTINPRPTAFVSGNTNFTVDGTNEYVSVLRADLTGFGPWNLKWSDGVSQTWTDPSPAIRTVTNSLSFFVQSFTNYVYQRLKSSGSSTTAPLTNSSAGLPVSIPNPDGTNSYYTNGTLVGILVTPPNVNTNVHLGQWQLYPTNKSYGSGGNKRYWNYFTIQTNVITTGPTNVLISTRFTYSVTNLTDANCVATTNDLSGSATVFLALGATADVSTPGSTNICLNDSVQVVAIFSGTPPWTAFWSDGTTNVVDVTNNPFAKFVTPTAAGLFTYTITNIMDGTRGVSTNITGGIAITVNALPTDVPVSSGDKTNCAGVANPPLTVTTGGALVNWYNVNYNLVAFSTNSFTPSDTEPGVYIYYAAETNSFGCTGTNVAVNLVLLDCLTNQPVISVAGTNVSVSWFGNVKLQSTTNLLTPWLDELTNPFVAQTNLLFPKFGPPPEKFFRLQIP